MRNKQLNKSVLGVGLPVAVIFGLRVLSVFVPQNTGTVDPRVVLAEDQTTQVIQRQRQMQANAFSAVSDGEVSRTEERIREATALATVTSMFAANESLNRRTPSTVIALLASVSAAGLLPPGMQLVGAKGEVSSPHGSLFVRYRPEPIGIEILSLGKARMDGPAILVRLPDSSFSDRDTDAVELYLATRLDEVQLPVPFASAAEVVALGFVPEPLRAAKLPKP
jgi:hypothetical protein